ncbi:hypothetical protein WR25_08601 isoform A [Diploscapter pachys]|uniref:Peptidase M12B domain-containing protein n=1 Tax=Diploscapter pachys TaxID=2018661 RepID=A0A2A2KNM5_9BILA|nr:hypothetical protein WR25_08601 isoform A [Diploscapter pachys]
MDDHFLVLQTLPKRVQHLQEEKHIIYKRDASLLTRFERSIQEEVARLQDKDEPFCDTSESLDEPNLAHLLHKNYSIPEAAKLDSPIVFPQLDPITLEIALFLDSKLFEHFEREYIEDAERHLMDFSLALINNVHVLYQQPTLSPNLEIVIVRFEMWKSQPNNLATYVHKNGQAQSLLDAFCRHQAHINPGSDLTDFGHWDHGVLLTGYDIYHTTASVAGVAPVARMCDPLFACSLVEGLHLGRSFVLAHEMGHNMGMVHDGVQNQCSRSCCLMSAVNGAGKTTWSECSVREFNAFLLQLDESGRGNCLRDASPGLTEHNHLSDGRLPGQRYTADQQCSYFWGREYKVEIPSGRTMDDICRILWCGNGGSTISTAHPALEGSWCGHNKWCNEGRCRGWAHFEMESPQRVDGGWSDWGGGEKRCPIQQCQVSGSITVRAQNRDCVNPAPNNGGHTCQGSSIRGLVCGTIKSRCQGFTRQEFSDKVCSSIKYDPHKPDLQLTGEGFEHSTQPCRVWCHLVDSELIRNKGQFPDGTPCGASSYCVGGQCLAVACNKQALVSSNGDCPEQAIAIAEPAAKWKDWSPWSVCSASCGKDGHQLRKRECTHSGRKGCSGKFVSKMPRKCCSESGPPEEYRSCVPEPKPCYEMSEWGQWNECDAECGDGQQTRKRICLEGDCYGEEMVQHRGCRKGGCWEEWGSYNECSASCGGGRRSRARGCLTSDCRGETTEYEDCNTHECLVETWSSWLPCSVSCGIGFQIRERLCNGVLCATANRQARTCNEQPCPVETTPKEEEEEVKEEDPNSFIFGDFEEWSPCSQTCGEGTQIQKRKCLKGKCPDGPESQRTRRCVLRPCPSWQDWTEWSQCNDCSPISTRARSRICESAAGFLDAGLCDGSPVELETCEKACNDGVLPFLSNDLRRRALSQKTLKLNEKFGEWSNFGPCSKECGGGTRSRTRVCYGESCAEKVQKETEKCNEQVCADDNEFRPWTDWSLCSASCGDTGVQTRRRPCPFFIFNCDAPTQTRPCPNMPPCESNSPSEKDAIPQWSEWSSYSACSCFTSTQTRRRFCRIRDPSLQGFCAGPIVEQRACKATSCDPIAGGWSSWSEWSLCSKDCGGTGHQIRNRMCSEPIPSNRGAYCVGYSFDQRPCSSNAVCGDKVDGDWGEWQEWSQCSDDCTNGHKSRTRYCSNPRPVQGGLQCFGSDFELKPCSDKTKCKTSLHNHVLPVSHWGSDAVWGTWSAWTECPQECGFSLQSRYRICETAQNSRFPCEGLAQQTSTCPNEPCDGSV